MSRTETGSISVRIAEAKERDLINAFYASEGRSVRVEEGERWVVAELSGRVIGVLRICFEEGHQVLRTVRVTRIHRRQGVGKRLLTRAQLAFDDRPCYCLPFTHLAGFYELIGFSAIPLEAAPEHLQQRLAGYLARGQDMIVMRRPAG